MLELIILGGLGYVLTWYKGVKFAVWTGIAICGVVLLALGLFVTVMAVPVAEAKALVEFFTGLFSFLFKGGFAVWVTVLIFGAIVGFYGAGIGLAQFMKHRKGVSS